MSPLRGKEAVLTETDSFAPEAVGGKLKIWAFDSKSSALSTPDSAGS